VRILGAIVDEEEHLTRPHQHLALAAEFLARGIRRAAGRAYSGEPRSALPAKLLASSAAG
jgi:hypothetical protein